MDDETPLQEYARRMVEAGRLHHAPLSGCPDCGQNVAGVFDHTCPEDAPARLKKRKASRPPPRKKK